MFASKTLLEHLARGAIGAGAIAGSLALSTTHGLLALALLPVALVALRGCPSCWTIGLFQTIAARLAGRSTAGLCADGGCARDARSSTTRRLS